MTEEKYKVLIKNSAKGDLKKLRNSPLQKQFENIVAQLKTNPYEPNQSFEKLVPPRGWKIFAEIEFTASGGIQN